MSKAKKSTHKDEQPILDTPGSSPGEDALEEREEAMLDEAIEETFPASDPIAVASYEEVRRRERERAGQTGSKR